MNNESSFRRKARFLSGAAALLTLWTLAAVPGRAQTDESWKLYDDSHLARVDITVDPAILSWVFANVESDSEHYAIVRFRNQWIDETVDSVGFRLRGNTSRQSAKKSFKISFNTFIRGRDFYGVEKLNLNGEHNDPSIVRSKLAWDLFRDIGIVASRANHAEVYINGTYYGLYVSVEHVNDAFIEKHFANDSGNLWKCLYPADLVYHGDDPAIYRHIESGGRPAYELKTNEEAADFSALARLIRILHATPADLIPDSLEFTFDVAGFLKYQAMNVLMGSWDDYWSLMNNYYLYHEPTADRITLIPYDYDNTFGIDWFSVDWSSTDPYNIPQVSSGQRPLSERILSYDQYHNLYTHFLEFYRDHVVRLDLWSGRIDSLRDRITTAAATDSFRTLDYGFTMSDFNDSYTAGHYQNQHVKAGIREFVNRRVSTLTGLVYHDTYPLAYTVSVSPRYPQAADSIVVAASCFGNAGIREVTVRATYDTSTSPYDVPATFRPVVGTKRVEEADRWIAVLPPLGEGAGASLVILVTDSLGRTMPYPRTNSLRVATPGQASESLVLNEFMADNDNVYADPAGDHDDWVEIFNRGSSPVLLTGMYLTDKPDNLTKWQFTQPDLYLQPGAYLVVWCDEEEAEPGQHTNFKLGAGGEFLALTEADGVTVADSLTFGPQTLDIAFARYPNGTGAWQQMAATPGAENSLSTAVAGLSVPVEASLAAYPQPFNSRTTFRFTLARPSHIDLRVFNMLGQEVVRLYNGTAAAGTVSVPWEAQVASGMYLCRLHAIPQDGTSDKRSEILKVLLLR